MHGVGRVKNKVCQTLSPNSVRAPCDSCFNSWCDLFFEFSFINPLSTNPSATADQLFECVWPFGGVDA